MPSVQSAWDAAGETPSEDVSGWYYWVFEEVDAGLGIDYNLTIAGGNKSSNLNAKEDECRDKNYKVVNTCPALPNGITSMVSPEQTMDDRIPYRKIIRDGHLYIETPQGLFTLSGTSVE